MRGLFSLVSGAQGDMGGQAMNGLARGDEQ